MREAGVDRASLFWLRERLKSVVFSMRRFLQGGVILEMLVGVELVFQQPVKV